MHLNEYYIRIVLRTSDPERNGMQLAVYSFTKYPRLKVGHIISIEDYGTPEAFFEIVDFGHNFTINMYTLVVIVIEKDVTQIA